jgi:hypothetical protein
LSPINKDVIDQKNINAGAENDQSNPVSAPAVAVCSSGYKGKSSHATVDRVAALVSLAAQDRFKAMPPCARRE